MREHRACTGGMDPWHVSRFPRNAEEVVIGLAIVSCWSGPFALQFV
jgi:hypothetical protein